MFQKPGFSMPAVDQIAGFYKFAKYNYYPGWHQQASLYELLINKDVYNSMSEHQKAVLEMITRASVADSLAFTESIQGPVIRENIEKHGVKVMAWSDEMLALFKEKWLEVVAEETAKDEFAKKVWEDLTTTAPMGGSSTCASSRSPTRRTTRSSGTRSRSGTSMPGVGEYHIIDARGIGTAFLRLDRR